MAFEYPSTITARKEKKKKDKKDSGYKVTEKEFSKITKPVFNKKGPKGEIAFDQLDAALSSENIGDGKKITKKGLKNIKGADIKEGDYDVFFQAAMKKFGISSPDELEDDKKKAFFNYVDKNYKADNETD